MSPVINPNTQDMADLSAIEPNTYKATIKACTAQKSKQSQNNMIVPVFDVTVKPGDVRERTAYLVIEGKGTYGFDQLLRACKMVQLADRYRAGEQVPFDTDTLIGQNVLVIIDQEEYKGQPRDRITGFLPA